MGKTVFLDDSDCLVGQGLILFRVAEHPLFAVRDLPLSLSLLDRRRSQVEGKTAFTGKGAYWRSA